MLEADEFIIQSSGEHGELLRRYVDLERVAIIQGFNSNDKDRLMASAAHLALIKDMDSVLGRAKQEQAHEHGPNRYIFSTLFLQHCFDILNVDEMEHMLYLSGVRLGKQRILSSMITFKLAKRSACGVEGDTAATTKALLDLHFRKLTLDGWAHIHPGTGIGATQPSLVDMNHQERLESLNYPTLGLVFSRDGLVRFFSNHMPFDVEICGEGVCCVEPDKKTFKLQGFDNQRTHGQAAPFP